jgi:putative ATP-binding cassette transporter
MKAPATKALAPLFLVSLCCALAAADQHSAVAGSTGPATATPGREVLAPLLASLPDRITMAMAEDRLVSVSMAVVLDQDVIFCRAFGCADLEQQRPAEPTTIYPMGSITKVFAATMLARLQEQGIVNLEDPVAKYVPEHKPRSPFAGSLPTTLRQLAAHTSGLPQDAPVNFWCDYTTFLWLVTGGQTPIRFYVDCDSLLASLGQPFTSYIEGEVLAPLGLRDTGFTLAPEQRRRLANGYVCRSPTAETMIAPAFDLGCALYSGGLFTTVEDLARFIASQWPEENADGNAVLRQGTLRWMRTPQSVSCPGLPPYGIGWGVVRIGDHQAIEHNGALPRYCAHVSAVPRTPSRCRRAEQLQEPPVAPRCVQGVGQGYPRRPRGCLGRGGGA